MGGFFRFKEATLTSFFVWHPWLYMLLVPAVGMRLWSEERRQGTLELLFTMPVNTAAAIAGKFLAGWIFLGFALLLTLPMPITVCYLGEPDLGPMLTGYIGSFLMAGAYLAISGMTSACTRNQVISFITSVVICLFLVLRLPARHNILLKWAQPTTRRLPPASSVMFHFEACSAASLISCSCTSPRCRLRPVSPPRHRAETYARKPTGMSGRRDRRPRTKEQR